MTYVMVKPAPPDTCDLIVDEVEIIILRNLVRMNWGRGGCNAHVHSSTVQVLVLFCFNFRVSHKHLLVSAMYKIFTFF